MNKNELLFQMMEQPQLYTAEEWQEILSDEECREIYTLMAKTKSAFDSQKEIDDKTIDVEWKKLTLSSRRNWLRVAAMFIGVLMLSGITFAAIHMLRFMIVPKFQPVPTEQPLQAKPTAAHPSDNNKNDSTIAMQAVVFENVPLDSIIKEIACYHHLDVELQNEEAKLLRFYFVWKQDDNLQEVIEKLNMFEHVNTTVENNKLIVK